jgi:hypothetical protein
MRYAVCLLILAGLANSARGEDDPDLPSMLYREEFENADQAKRLVRTGNLDSARTFAFSRWAVRGATGADRCSEILIKQDNPMFTTSDTARLIFSILVTAKTEVQIQAIAGQKGFLHYAFTPIVVNGWSVISLPLGDFLNDKSFRIGAGAAVTSLKFKTAEPAEMWIDDVLALPDPPKEDLTDALLRVRLRTDAFAGRVLAQRRAQTLTIRRDLAILNPEIVAHLRLNVWRKDRVTPKTILNFGGEVAASRSFFEPLLAPKGPLEGCTLIPKMTCTSSGGTLDGLKLRFTKALAEQKPEVVTLILSVVDFKGGKTPKMIVDEFMDYGQLAADAGAIPVMYTPPIPNAGPAADFLRELVPNIRRQALARHWPVVDAFAAVNSWYNEGPRQEFLSGGGPSTAGYKAIDDGSRALYEKLDEWVFDRRPRHIPAVQEANLAAAEEPVGGTPFGPPQVETKGAPKKAEPAKAEPKKPAEPPRPEPKKSVNDVD